MRHIVTDDDTATALGSGDVPVLATPRVIAWMEAETVRAAAPHLGAGRTSVGTAVRVAHKRPTPVGGLVDIAVTATHFTGSRQLTFVLTVTDGGGQIVAEGEVDRVIVDRKQFLDRATRG